MPGDLQTFCSTDSADTDDVEGVRRSLLASFWEHISPLIRPEGRRQLYCIGI
jgi:hypothetical protein